ncbi:3-epi-6-deoxocathasterone 23-monooxygenase [Nymphaea thermarum]|nr:3-epi-6-deoxocathasterone 23-monooxygenase [Nymphaea thermarum]
MPLLQMVLELMVKQLLDIDPSEEVNVMAKEFRDFTSSGIGCLPIRFPGTRFYRKLKGLGKFSGEFFWRVSWRRVPGWRRRSVARAAGSPLDEGKGEVEKRRRFQVEGQEAEGGGFPALKLALGEQVYSVGEANGVDDRNCKRSKVQGGGTPGTGTSSSAGRPACQVEGCGVDLSSAKDYHRRHKVCETLLQCGCALQHKVKDEDMFPYKEQHLIIGDLIFGH